MSKLDSASPTVPPDTARRTFGFEAGCLVRGSILSQLQAGALRWDVKLEHAEDRGFLSSYFTFAISGPRQNVEGFLRAFQDWCNRLERE